MEWWNDFSQWLTAPDTRPALFTAAVIAVSIIVSGLLSAAIAKSGLKRLVAQRDREQRAAAIATIIDAATEATVWSSLGTQEQVLADRAVAQADIQLRLLPARGASTAADWAAHQLAEMKRASASYGFEFEPVIAEFRDRLLDWQERPARAKKVFAGDIENWSYDEERARAEKDTWSSERHRDLRPSDGLAARLPEPATVDASTRKLIDDVAALDAGKRPAQPSDEKTA